MRTAGTHPVPYGAVRLRDTSTDLVGAVPECVREFGYALFRAGIELRGVGLVCVVVILFCERRERAQGPWLEMWWDGIGGD